MKINKMIKSFKFALDGLKHMIKYENNFRFQVLATLIINLIAFLLKFKTQDWCIILLCCAGVLSLEIINTAIEKTVDLVSPEQNPKAGLIKDIAAGAVLLFSIFSTIVGLMICWGYVEIYVFKS